MTKRKTPFTDEYLKEHNAFLNATIIVFGVIGMVAIVTAIVLSITRPGYEPVALVTMALVMSLWATIAVHRRATLRELVELCRAIQQLREERNP